MNKLNERLTLIANLSVVVGLLLVWTSDATAQMLVRQEAPTDRAADFPLAELEATFRQMDADDLSTVRLLEGGTHNVNIRRLRGGETALIHEVTTDVWVVREGSGTLVTGGTLVDEDGLAVDGPRGAAIRGGVTRVIGVGDVVFIPAGVPHGIRDSDGITWLNIRFDTR